MIVCRTPTDQELKILINYYEGRIHRLDKNEAEDLLTVGEYPNPPGLDTIQLASLMQVITSIYNLEETISKT